MLLRKVLRISLDDHTFCTPYRDLNQQFLFDEVEAEVNLAFDQLIFNISKQIYIYAKHCASQLMLDKPYKVASEVW